MRRSTPCHRRSSRSWLPASTCWRRKRGPRPPEQRSSAASSRAPRFRLFRKPAHRRSRHMSSSSSAGVTSVRPPRLPTRRPHRFGHALLRDVAYASLPKVERAELHESYGDWLGATTDAPDEVVGFHLEQAHNYRTELGPADPAREAAGGGCRRASWFCRHACLEDERHSGDGEPARARERAAAARRLVAPRAPVRARCRRARWRAGRTGSTSFLRRAGREAKEAKDVRVELRARLELGYFELLSKPEGAAQALLEIAQHAIPTFEAFEDDRALGRAWLMAGYVNGGHPRPASRLGRGGRARPEHYERAGSPASTCVHQLARRSTSARGRFRRR